MASNFVKKNSVLDRSAEINQLLSKMCMNEEYSDVTFIVEGTRIPAHKMILSARSFYFKSMFGGAFNEAKQAEIELKVPLNAFEAILKYIYTGCLSLHGLQCDEIVDIYDLANQYDFSTLKSFILNYMTANITLTNCVEILNAAQLYSLDDLQNSCLTFMDSNSTRLLGHDIFKELPLSSLCALLNRDSFYASEVEIFNAICKWHTSNQDVDIKEALSTVRWSKLSSDELSNVIFRSNILDRAEFLVLMEGNSSKMDRIPSELNKELLAALEKIDDWYQDWGAVVSAIESGANIEAKTINGYTALHWASSYGNLEIVKFLIERGADIEAKEKNFGCTALLMSSWNGYLKVVKFLIESGADVNAKSNYGKTALLLSSVRGNLEISKYLVEKGANINILILWYKTKHWTKCRRLRLWKW